VNGLVPRTLYRSMGEAVGPERIGCGFMDKSGVSTDLAYYRAPTYSLVYLLRGRGRYVDEHGRVHALEAGSCFQRIPGVPHSTHPDPNSGWFEGFYDLGPGLFAALAAMRVIKTSPIVFHIGVEPARVRRLDRLCNAVEAAGEPELATLCADVIAEIVSAQARAQNPEPAADAVDRACQLLGARVSDRQNLEAFCFREGLDYETFRKQFRRRTGVSPAQYRIRRRIDRACELLQTSSRTVERIALELGYASPYEFSAQFARRMGMPPSKYRRLGKSLP
jgi:AraC family transcriptional regulator, arabinose operon regulatory protein